MLDHSFPHGVDELQAVAISLGELEQLLKAGEIAILLTDALAAFISDDKIEWGQLYPLFLDVHRLISTLFLQPHSSVIQIPITLDEVAQYRVHPVPARSHGALIDQWADEVGRVLVIHDQCNQEDEYFIGIACPYGFSGEEPDTYDIIINDRAFPIVGSESFQYLADAFEWVVPQDIHQRLVSLDHVRRNYRLLGAVQMDDPQGDSHYKIHFPNRRPWTLSRNVDPIPDRFLNELKEMTPYPIRVIKTILVEGRVPSRTCKLHKKSNG